ncbi:hypothetical protein L226DRAFT_567889 [Lentinus tigrinus ALCF2SS1-7]|uniref:EthD domain-containing protein n=1 Tax=Lentinus tigrinus ALCF2SS1-6 TaxID=1328759 RepID=A0A5C2SJF1_9APHY|nr:hypothetical protein L227DRAFT_572378 [Lentinus tigrinus ALCF2SS1-6]RPD78214.1 hypothetical protein L226DRAFT_567889 [Lentinus tigrinus ALCF2SS1-7]
MSTGASLRSDRVRLVILVAPKPGLSPDECRSYWLNTHSKVFSSIAIVKRNLLKYEQFHFDSRYTAPMTAMIPGYMPPPFFGMAIFEAETIEKIYEVFQDEEYRRVVVPDEENFMSRKDVQMLGGPLVTVYGA